MYLRALEIQGFKSFPDKTVLNFGEDITAIVGPNGSGKSNISDAIRWVMGEQSVKGLRGAKMEDVIFGGTEKRSQVGFAQVTLVLDNTEHIFPTMEESEVSVTRRYYRSGESEYYINRQSVRLKDLTELFLDTGMGREGYSIIGQGKIDEILSAKSGERREIFEEAAGISKFRHRKEEAERKLERTEENLVRINDKIAELELQVEPLREQAEKARKYLVLRDELRLLEISVWLENLDTLKAGARKLEADFHAAESQRDEARAALDALYAEGERYSERMREKDMEAERVRTESAVLEEQIKEKESATAVLESTVTHNRENIQRAEAELAEAESRSGGLAKQAEEQEARVAEIDRRIGELNGALAALLETAQTMAEQAGGAQNEAERLRAQEALAMAAAADARAQAEAALSGQSELLEKSGALAEEISGRKSDLAALAAEREATVRSAADLRALCADLSGDREQKEQMAETYRRNIAAAEEEIAGLQTALEELAGRGAAFRQRLAAITEEKNALEAERTAKNRAGQEMNENLLNLERAVAKLDQKRATSAMEEKQILDRLWEHYELSHSDAQAQRIELESVPKANRRIGELKRDITALGTPNIGAIDEFQRVNTRYTYLTDQRNDVEKAKGELQNIIGEITEEMTKIFAEQFKLLSESFQTTFQELFGGGTARLELEDEEDILGCGIEIKAQPPGKTLKTISLLSGGEKAFVAIALYFSILKVHPTPFCVMDEIEAALDDANVTRYARYMRTLAGRTQFIVITHRRGTMEEADVLYGVTMQEQGVSKILTINLNDMAKELKIK